MARGRSGIGGLFAAVLGIVSALALSVTPAMAGDERGRSDGAPYGEAKGASADHSDNGNEGAGSENGDGPTAQEDERFGYTQGKSGSRPDQDGIGMDRGIDNNDKDADADTDGNNGCGNDPDREDDNNGWCGKPPEAGAVGGEAAVQEDEEVDEEVEVETEVGGIVEERSSEESGGLSPDVEVLGIRERRAPAVAAASAGGEPGVGALAVTGIALMTLLPVGIGSTIAGLALRRRMH